jgi:hypothetical protein
MEVGRQNPVRFFEPGVIKSVADGGWFLTIDPACDGFSERPPSAGVVIYERCTSWKELLGQAASEVLGADHKRLHSVPAKQERTTMASGIRRSCRVSIALLGCISLGSPATAQQSLTGSESYRAEKCAGQYTCDEDGASAVAWGPAASPGGTLSAKLESESLSARSQADSKNVQPPVATDTQKLSTIAPTK